MDRPLETIPWGDARAIQLGLIAEGWRTPSTYSDHFDEITDRPAVYLFLLMNRETYREAIVAYVGMSTRLSQRLSGHNILPLLSRDDLWPMRWFKPVERRDLRRVEREYITRFDPPWNIVGRRRGVKLQ